MMKRAIIYAIVMVAFAAGCKKGEDDPFISLRTRKARLTGEWHCVSGSAILTVVDYQNAARINFDYIFNAGRYTLTITGDRVPTTETGKYQLNLNIRRDGSFDFTELSDNNISASGTWDFLFKSASTRNKEEVAFVIDKVTTGSTGDWTIFNWNYNDMRYRIKELRNKKLVLFSDYDKVVSNGKEDFSVKSELVFEQ